MVRLRIRDATSQAEVSGSSLSLAVLSPSLHSHTFRRGHIRTLDDLDLCFPRHSIRSPSSDHPRRSTLIIIWPSVIGLVDLLPPPLPIDSSSSVFRSTYSSPRLSVSMEIYDCPCSVPVLARASPAAFFYYIRFGICGHWLSTAPMRWVCVI
ncbi:hypothetical protein VTO73DRAFT_2639 [Trametes versicolor]